MKRSPLLRKLRFFLRRLVAEQIVLVLTLLFCVGATLTVVSVWQLSEQLIQSQAQQNAATSVQNLQMARTLYSDSVVGRIREQAGITATHDYRNIAGGIPLPATYFIELGEQISSNQAGVGVRLYSNYPFPWRKETGGARDQFEREAIAFLEQHPEQTFANVETFANRLSLRYAAADVMKPSCIACHNSHPDSPRRNWQVGDVRGVVEVIQPLDSLVQKTQWNLVGLLGLLLTLFILGLSGLVIAIRRLNNISQNLELEVIERTADLVNANQELLFEQEKSNSLLLNILPPKIARQLKDGSKPVADGFGNVTILFADIVGFTKLSESYPPRELVDLLNEIFSAFDNLCESLRLEKIKTIGDAYMVAAGLPEPREDHAAAIAEMALAMQRELMKINVAKNINITLRIGINSGPVVAGVIGKKKFIYDLWGDAVNTASRMESHGLPGQIQVTESTYELLKNQYHFEPRGAIEIKGKGKMQTYFLQ
ncbi:adenylate/guanylate cyclase domain-containing protein [[Limnothrix rosea] IAM M-220]|uniref:adenylate/guanylate cyclase domain-containing protein n=1 Tax=[Limnothrix rosea] IAM M-220 TaxID=454133 RepID=UPI00095CF692|nr:adenylate/guanylate cyclase domain-containing protein [[Limnothrix rosea] IAM M-220]OKH15234.1 adenylate/guanylate cyclase [[Limnothrix rosea] IAM M-220]